MTGCSAEICVSVGILPVVMAATSQAHRPAAIQRIGPTA